jgi:hypothetical protein
MNKNTLNAIGLVCLDFCTVLIFRHRYKTVYEFLKGVKEQVLKHVSVVHFKKQIHFSVWFQSLFLSCSSACWMLWKWMRCPRFVEMFANDSFNLGRCGWEDGPRGSYWGLRSVTGSMDRDNAREKEWAEKYLSSCRPDLRLQLPVSAKVGLG